MDRCLAIKDLVLNILRHTSTGDKKEHQATLAAMARTSKLFFDYTIEALWEQQDGLENLLKCMPSSACRRISRHSGEVQMVLTYSACGDDWKRFDLYARRVRYLTIAEPSESGRSKAFLKSLRILASRAPPIVIFPNLKQLHCAATSDETLLHLRAFFGPSILTCAIECSSYLRSLEPLLYHIPLLSPWMQELRIDTFPGDFSPSHRIKDILDQFRRLRSLTIKACKITSLEFLTILAESLPDMRYLSLNCIAPLRQSSKQASRTSLASLTEFTFSRNVDGLQAIMPLTQLFQTFSLSSLCELRIEDVHIPDPKALANFFTAMPEAISHETLTTLSLASFDLGTKMSIPSSVLEPLFAFRNLESIHIEIFYKSILLNDEAFGMFSRSWPKLKTFHIDTDPSMNDDDPRPTFMALTKLISGCPHLKEIAVSFDADVNVFNDTCALKRIPANTSIETINVLLSRISEGSKPAEVALILSYLLPNLTRVRVSRENDFHEEWMQVEETLSALSKVKRIERDCRQ